MQRALGRSAAATAIFAWATLAVPLALGADRPPSAAVPIDDFEGEPKGWKFVGGEEFPGAKGSFVRDTGRSHGGKASYRLDADFRGGGAYVGCWKDLARPGLPDVDEFRLWVLPRNLAGSASGSSTRRASATRSRRPAGRGRRTAGARSCSRSATSSAASTGGRQRRRLARPSQGPRPQHRQGRARPRRRRPGDPLDRRPEPPCPSPPGRPTLASCVDRAGLVPAGVRDADHLRLGRRAAGLELQRLRPLRRREGADDLPGRPRPARPDGPMVRPGRVRPDGRRADRPRAGALRRRRRPLGPQARRGGGGRRPFRVGAGADGPARRRLPRRHAGGRGRRPRCRSSRPRR